VIPPVGQLVDGEAHHGEHADELDEVAQRTEQRLEADGDHLRGEGALVLAAVAGGLVRLAVVGLDQREVAQALLGDRTDRAGPPAQLPRGGLDAPGQPAGHRQEAGRGDQGRQREPPVEIEQHPGEEDDLEGIGQRHVHAGHDQRLDGGDVSTQTRHHVAELAPLEESEGQPLHVGEQMHPQVEHEFLAHPCGQVFVDPGDGALNDCYGQIEGGDRNEEPEVVRGEHIVDEHFVEIDARCAESGNGAGEQQAHRHPAAEPAGLGPEPCEHRAQRDLRGLLDEAVVLVVRCAGRGRIVLGGRLRWVQATLSRSDGA
jgi:hypothetical protein